jgi:hypothetical protein
MAELCEELRGVGYAMDKARDSEEMGWLVSRRKELQAEYQFLAAESRVFARSA